MDPGPALGLCVAPNWLRYQATVTGLTYGSGDGKREKEQRAALLPQQMGTINSNRTVSTLLPKPLALPVSPGG